MSLEEEEAIVCGMLTTMSGFRTREELEAMWVKTYKPVEKTLRFTSRMALAKEKDRLKEILL